MHAGGPGFESPSLHQQFPTTLRKTPRLNGEPGRFIGSYGANGKRTILGRPSAAKTRLEWRWACRGPIGVPWSVVKTCRPDRPSPRPGAALRRLRAPPAAGYARPRPRMARGGRGARRACHASPAGGGLEDPDVTPGLSPAYIPPGDAVQPGDVALFSQLYADWRVAQYLLRTPAPFTRALVDAAIDGLQVEAARPARRHVEWRGCARLRRRTATPIDEVRRLHRAVDTACIPFRTLCGMMIRPVLSGPSAPVRLLLRRGRAP